MADVKDKDLKGLKVVELKKELNDRGLSITGNKSDLISRLEEHLLKQGDDQEETVVEVGVSEDLTKGEEDIYSKVKSISSSSEGEMCSRLECSNLHKNDKLSELLNDFKLQFQQLKEVTELNKISIDNLESKCKALQSSSDTTRLELYKLRNEYEVICFENANLKKENAEYLACMNGLAGTIADLNIKIKTLDEEKASLEASVRLLNEDKRQLILKNNNLGYDREREDSLVETTQVKSNEDTYNNQNSIPKINGSIEQIDLVNTSQERNGPINNSHTTITHFSSGKSISKETLNVNENNGLAPVATTINIADKTKAIPKHKTPCPFLKKRGYCLKGKSCDFLHQNSHSTDFPVQQAQSLSGNTFYPYMPQANHHPFLVNTAYFPPFQPRQYHPMFRQFSYPPPLMSVPTRPPVY